MYTAFAQDDLISNIMYVLKCKSMGMSRLRHHAVQAAQERDAWQREWSKDKARLQREREQLTKEVQVRAGTESGLSGLRRGPCRGYSPHVLMHQINSASPQPRISEWMPQTVRFILHSAFLAVRLAQK